MPNKTSNLIICASKLFVICILLINIGNGISSFIKVYAAEQYSFVGKWGSKGVNFGQFTQPSGVGVDSKGDIYVADLSGLANKIQKFTSNGTFIKAWAIWVLVLVLLRVPHRYQLIQTIMFMLQTWAVLTQLCKNSPLMALSLCHGARLE